MRHLQIAAALLIGLLGLLFFFGNLFNLPAAIAAVGMIVSGQDQPFYSVLGPTPDAAWIHAVALACIMGGELAVGLLGLFGAWSMLRARHLDEQTFHQSKTAAVAAGATGMLVWFGLFIVIGEGYFHMWQSEAGTGSANGAFRYGGICGLLMLFIALDRRTTE